MASLTDFSEDLSKLDPIEALDDGAGPDARLASIFALVGLGVGICVYVLTLDLVDFGPYLAAVLIALAAFLTGFLFSTERGRAFRSLAFAIVLAAALGGLASWRIVLFEPSDFTPTERVFGLIVACAIIAGISIPFFRTSAQRGLSPTDYPSLFEIAWNTLVIGLASGLFAALAYGVVLLGGALFGVIGIEAPMSAVLTKSWFVIPFSFAAFALAVGVIRARERLVLALRAIVFALVRLVGPILLVASAAFLPAFALRGFAAFSDDFSAAALLTVVAFLGVVHMNAILGDGAQSAEIPKVSVLLARAQGVVLPAIMAIAVIAVWLRIQQHGLTPDRLLAAIVIGIAALYAVVYALGAVLPGGFAFIRGANIALAGLVALIAAALQTPLLQPETLSARNQQARLLSGQSSSPVADVAAIKLFMGRPGAEVLETLRVEAGGANNQELLDALERAQSIDSPWQINQMREAPDSFVAPRVDDLYPAHLTMSPAEASLPADLLEQVRQEEASNGWSHELTTELSDCATPDFDCYGARVDLTGDADAEVLLFVFEGETTLRVTSWRRDRDGWRRDYALEPYFVDAPETIAAARTSLRTGDIQTRELTVRAPVFGDQTFTPSAAPPPLSDPTDLGDEDDRDLQSDPAEAAAQAATPETSGP